MLPQPLFLALQELTQKYSLEDLKKNALSVSDVYRNAPRDGKRLVSDELSVASYALTRMPATFEVVSDVFKKIPHLNCQTLLDVGAGTGAGTWAALSEGVVSQVICLEREPEMSSLGQELIGHTYSNVQWLPFDLSVQNILQKADIVLSSYVLNELVDAQRKSAIDKMWNATKQFLVLIDNGTPKAFEMMQKIRSYLIGKGGFMVAPCTHMENCSNAWCHFMTRVARTKIHRILKKGEAPFEDEKFTYLVFSKKPVKMSSSRVLRHPRIEKGKIDLQLCTANGIKNEIISKKDGNLFKNARKIVAGDAWE